MMTIKQTLNIGTAFIVGGLVTSIASKPVILSGNEDELAVEVRQGKLDAYSDGEPRGTLVKWLNVKSGAKIVGQSAKVDYKTKRVYIERYAIWWSPFSRRLPPSSEVWIPSSSLDGDRFQIFMRNRRGEFAPVGYAE